VPVTPWNMIAVVTALRAIAALAALLLCVPPAGTQTEVDKPPAVEKPAGPTPAPSKFRGDDGWLDVSGFLGGVRAGRQRLGPTVTAGRPVVTSRP